MFEFIEDLFPICRSITGPGQRETLNYIKNILPELNIYEVKSGTKVFDWTIPNEWIIRKAYVEDEKGNRIIDFKNNNLHLVGYSIPVDKWLSLEELKEHLHYIPEQPNAIPYVTSYYKKQWGFCITYEQLKQLKSGKYYVHIDSDLKPGKLNYGELILPGRNSKEVFISTYICHPSMANNELSGPAVTTFIAKWLEKQDRNFTYRIIYIPETIGSITYLSYNLKDMKKNIIAGFNVTCVGDDNNYSFLPSIQDNTLADRISRHVLKHLNIKYTEYSFLERGSDERQYCSPGVDLPVVSLMRSKYGTYPEYHTSLDNLDFISPTGLKGSYDLLKKCIQCIEMNISYMTTVICEPQLSSKELYPTTSKRGIGKDVQLILNILAYSNGNRSLLEIAEKFNLPIWKILPIVDILVDKKLLKPVD
ncbi:MAG: aminopeptidase [Candidatus Marinimicrobia bacterium]|nr:aminopeptidase [Candidatus Neomarinimicrobiota bacterium]